MPNLSKKIIICAGILCGLLLPLSATELYLRWFPVKDIYPFLGEDSPLKGDYRPQERFGITYRSWDAMVNENKLDMEAYPSLLNHDLRPLWLFYGTSFARFLTTDCAQAVRDRRSVVLHKHGLDLPLQMAQLEMLLDHGLRPQRIFFVMLTLEGEVLGEHPLRTRHINSKGATVYYPRQAPGVLNWLVTHSRLGLTIWVRSGQAMADPGFKGRELYHHVNQQILDDFRRLYRDLADVTRPKGIKVTIILIPRYGQILKDQGFGYQEGITPMLESLGYDVIDPRKDFLAATDREALFLPDGHLSKLGNGIIIDTILKREQVGDSRVTP